MAAGQRALELLNRSANRESQAKIAQAAQLKTFVLQTVHESHRPAVPSQEPHKAIAFLSSMAPQANLNLVNRAAKVKPLVEYGSTAEYIAAHRDRHDRFLSANS